MSRAAHEQGLGLGGGVDVLQARYLGDQKLLRGWMPEGASAEGAWTLAVPSSDHRAVVADVAFP
jgi:hypothetical protein